jgi:mycofactocin system transcriptional regulator
MNTTAVSPGRPPVTSHAEIEAAAFRLFVAQGFDETTTDDIAELAGIGRRTLFRYFPSKFDIPWGQFDASLEYFSQALKAAPAELPLWQGVQSAVVQFNTFDPAVLEQHRTRMRLILETPSLQAHSVLMYERWRAVIANYVAARTGQPSDGLLPRSIGHISLGLAISAYEQWLRPDAADLEQLLMDAMSGLRQYLHDH